MKTIIVKTVSTAIAFFLMLAAAACAATTDIRQIESDLQSLTDALEKTPKDVTLHLNRGLLLVARGRFDRSLEDFNFVANADPRNPDVYVYRGLAFLAKSDFENALSDFDADIKLTADSTDAHLGRAMTLYGKGDYEAARDEIAVFLKSAPDSSIGFLNAAKISLAMRNFSSADGFLAKTIEAYSKDGNGGEDIEAVKIIKQKMEDEKTLNANDLADVGDAAWDGENYEKAKNFYMAALMLEPENQDFVYNLAMILREEGDYAASSIYLYRYLYLVPKAEDRDKVMGYIERMTK
jgi:tetratricopeptide (TPR) repeat protein